MLLVQYGSQPALITKAVACNPVMLSMDALASVVPTAEAIMLSLQVHLASGIRPEKALNKRGFAFIAANRARYILAGTGIDRSSLMDRYSPHVHHLNI